MTEALPVTDVSLEGIRAAHRAAAEAGFDPRSLGVCVGRPLPGVQVAAKTAALANVLLGYPMVRRFHADPRVRASDSLLQERIVRHVPITSPRPTETTHVGPPPPAAQAWSASEPCGLYREAGTNAMIRRSTD